MIGRHIKAAIKRALRAAGYVINPVGSPADRSTMEGAFRALHKRGHRFGTVIDIGASNGSWSADLMRYFPSCSYLLVEAQPVHEPALREFCARHPNAQYVLAAAGDREGTVYFDAADPFGGQASSVRAANMVELPVVTLDAELARRNLPGPYLLKFDTHGFEVPILKGAAQALRATEAIVMECYNFRISPECLTFPEICQLLAGEGFRCIDLVAPLHRPYDDSFWQMDLVFARSDRPEFAYSSYR